MGSSSFVVSSVLLSPPFVCVSPREVFSGLDGDSSTKAGDPSSEETTKEELPLHGIAETAPEEDETRTRDIDFHDLLKAQCMQVGVPLQLVRPGTYGAEGSEREESVERIRTQDAATRAWNLHVALYYKAGGTPWRIADV